MLPPDDGFIEVRSAEGHFLFRYNQERRIIEIKRGNLWVYVDLDILDLPPGTESDKPAVYTSRQFPK